MAVEWRNYILHALGFIEKMGKAVACFWFELGYSYGSMVLGRRFDFLVCTKFQKHVKHIKITSLGLIIVRE